MPKCGMQANTQVAVSGRSVYETVVSPPRPRAVPARGCRSRPHAAAARGRARAGRARRGMTDVSRGAARKTNSNS